MVDSPDAMRLDDERLDALGLTDQPFTDIAFTYTDEDRETRLNITLGVLQSTSALVVVTGEPGTGKSSFLRQLGGLDDNLVFAHVRATSDMRLAEILRAIGAQGGETVASAASRHVRESPGRLVLAIDDAQTLPEQALGQLAALQIKLAERDQELPVVLACGREAAPSILEVLEAKRGTDTALHEVVLGGFGPAETRAYLRARLAEAGGDYSVLNERQMERIHARSEGVPARINVEAARELNRHPRRSPLAGLTLPALPAINLERLRQWRPSLPAVSPGALRLGLIIAVPLVATAAVGAWLISGDGGAEPRRISNDPAAAAAETAGTTGDDESRRVALPDREKTRVADNATQGDRRTGTIKRPESNGTEASPVSTASDTDRAAGEASRDPDDEETVDDASGAPALSSSVSPTGETTEQSSPASPAGDNGGNSADNGRTGGKPRSDGNTGRTNDGRDASRAGDDAASATADAERSAGPPRDGEPGGDTGAANDLQTDAEWLAERPEGHYTIQILGAYQPSTIRRFLARIEGDAQTRILRTRREGERWYVLVTGDYASRDAARNAIPELPEGWRAHGPFLRSFASLRE